MRQSDQLSSLPSGSDRAVSHADVAPDSTGNPCHPQSNDESLHFPFKENTVARKAKPPGAVEDRYEHSVERSHSAHQHGESNERPSSPPSTAEHEEHPRRQESDETVLPTNSDGTLASDLSSVAHQVTPSVLPFREEAQMSDQTLLNTVARNPKAGRVTGGLSGQMEEVHHAPATQADKDLEAKRVASLERADQQEREEVAQEHEELSRRVSQSSVVQRATESRPLSPANSYARPTSSLGSSARRERETQVERWKRKAKLAEKLRVVFGLDEVEQVVHEMGCWLLRSVCQSLPSFPLPNIRFDADGTPCLFFGLRSAARAHVRDDRAHPLLRPHARQTRGLFSPLHVPNITLCSLLTPFFWFGHTEQGPQERSAHQEVEAPPSGQQVLVRAEERCSGVVHLERRAFALSRFICSAPLSDQTFNSLAVLAGPILSSRQR